MTRKPIARKAAGFTYTRPEPITAQGGLFSSDTTHLAFGENGLW